VEKKDLPGGEEEKESMAWMKKILQVLVIQFLFLFRTMLLSALMLMKIPNVEMVMALEISQLWTTDGVEASPLAVLVQTQIPDSVLIVAIVIADLQERMLPKSILARCHVIIWFSNAFVTMVTNANGPMTRKSLRQIAS
jgi:hypothetical protein